MQNNALADETFQFGPAIVHKFGPAWFCMGIGTGHDGMTPVSPWTTYMCRFCKTGRVTGNAILHDFAFGAALDVSEVLFSHDGLWPMLV
jgi:hypothetical protein